MAIEQKILLAAVKACSKNELDSADEACISDYIADHFGTEGWDADVLNTDLSYLVENDVLYQDNNERYIII